MSADRSDTVSGFNVGREAGGGRREVGGRIEKRKGKSTVGEFVSALICGRGVCADHDQHG